MTKAKTAILLVNVGTPDHPTKKAVRKYLTQFLNDKRVIDLPWLLRVFLVNCIIIPFRTSKSTKLYEKLWTSKGSPLLFYSNSLVEKLQKRLGKEYGVYLAMRYQNPSFEKALKDIQIANYKKVLLFPLYPQYATSTSLTSIEECMRIAKKIKLDIEIEVQDQFFNQPEYLKAVINQASEFEMNSYDHVLFSFHGLPVNQVEDTHPGYSCSDLNCTNQYNTQNTFCYHAACYETARLLANKLKLSSEQFTICFQSRFAKKWLSPFTDEVLISLAKSGKKNVLVFCPSFVADCLETTIEISDEYHELFIQNGGEKLDLIPSLNDSDEWITTLEVLIAETLKA